MLTTEHEAKWRKWIGIYNEMLRHGDYRLEPFDIGIDKPKHHAFEKNGRMAVPSCTQNGPIELGGLGAGRWRVRD